MRNLKCVTIFLRKKLIWMRRSKKINAMNTRSTTRKKLNRDGNKGYKNNKEGGH